jgi:hypothetical protein
LRLTPARRRTALVGAPASPPPATRHPAALLAIDPGEAIEPLLAPDRRSAAAGRNHGIAEQIRKEVKYWL